MLPPTNPLKSPPSGYLACSFPTLTVPAGTAELSLMCTLILLQRPVYSDQKEAMMAESLL